MIKIKFDGVPGYFLSEGEMAELNKVVEALKQEVEKAKGEQKYKLKKLSQIIERKDKQLAKLTKSQKKF